MNSPDNAVKIGKGFLLLLAVSVGSAWASEFGFGIAGDARELDVGFSQIQLARKGREAFAPPFSTNEWKVMNYSHLLDVRSTGDGIVLGGALKKCDTAWKLESRRHPIPAAGRNYASSGKCNTEDWVAAAA